MTATNPCADCERLRRLWNEMLVQRNVAQTQCDDLRENVRIVYEERDRQIHHAVVVEDAYVKVSAQLDKAISELITIQAANAELHTEIETTPEIDDTMVAERFPDKILLPVSWVYSLWATNTERDRAVGYIKNHCKEETRIGALLATREKGPE